MSPRALVSVAALVLLASSGCHGLHIDNGKLGCAPGPKHECPGGYHCDVANNKCWLNGDAATDGAGGRSDVASDRASEAGLDTATDVGTQPDAGGPGCVPDTSCMPANPCHLGKTVCDAGGASCMDTTMSQGDGTPCGTGMVCHAGACGACADGSDCAPAGEPCHTGTTSCATGVAVCMQSGNVAEGKSCGTNMACSSGTCVACVTGAPCAPTNTCHMGKLDCSTGSPVCADQATNVAAGTSCGTDMVCGATGCVACKVGGSCAVTNPCRVGTLSCNTGAPLCAESGNAPDGQSCGGGKVCNGGSCLACAAGTSCTPANSCHAGTISCAGGAATCVDGTTALANGASCGTDMVCSAGTCGACAANKACTPPGTMCKVGTTSCATGASVCLPTGNIADGTSCGSSMVCSGGTCVACAGGTSCKPTTAPCHNGTLACGTGVPVCTDAGTNLVNGATCGTNLYCFNGGCNTCTPSQPCTPGGNVCLAGTTSCATGTSVCASTGNVANGTSCGSGMVCNAGMCVACANGSSCTPSAVCHNGTLACGTGSPVCTDSGTNKTNGATCGTNFYCFNGACGACTPGQTCVPGGNVCQTGSTSCTTGTSTCTATGNVGNGTSCGTGKICSNGACVARPNGSACATATDCGSGNCVDGACCSTSSCSTCNRCNLNGVGTCSAVSRGADALCPISAAGCTAGCDGLGKCTPANAGTDCVTPVCTQSDSVGSVAHVGVFTSVSFKRSACDGVTAGVGGCKAQPDSGCGNYVCAGATTCKATCAADVDCKSGLRCSSGTCVAKAAAGTACTSGEQCATAACALQEFVDSAPVCHACSTNAQCPTTSPVCLSDSWSCTGCGIGDPADCNADGSTNCNVGGCYASTARDCGKPSIAANHCSCGALDKCPSWMVCINSACKVAGGHPCVGSSDCATGTCQAGLCSQTPLGGFCIGDIPNECASGSCGPNFLNGPGGFPLDGMICE